MTMRICRGCGDVRMAIVGLSGDLGGQPGQHITHQVFLSVLAKASSRTRAIHSDIVCYGVSGLLIVVINGITRQGSW